MYTDKAQKEMPAGSVNSAAGHTDNHILSNPAQRIKVAAIWIASWLAVIFRGVA